MSVHGSSREEYDFMEKIGDGAFGQVYRAKHRTTQQLVAIKTVKHKNSNHIEDPSDYRLREYRTLRMLETHPNVVQLYKSFIASSDELHLVMEYVNGGNLCQFIHDRRESNNTIEHSEIRRMTYQLLQALAHIHKQGIFHRDLKPENVLLMKSETAVGGVIVKLGDFGLARPVNSKRPYTEYVSTRWYRAPEVLLRSSSYSFPVDMWAFGTILAEMVTLSPLFPGSTEIDQLYRICSILGSPGNSKTFTRKSGLRTERRNSPGFARKKVEPPPPTPSDPDNEWKEGVKLAQRMGFQFPQLPPKPLELVMPKATPAMLDLLRQLLYYDPSRRLDAQKALQHPLFAEEAALSQKGGARPRRAELHRDCNKRARTTYHSQTDIRAFDLLPMLIAPLQVCPDWEDDNLGTRAPDEYNVDENGHLRLQPMRLDLGPQRRPLLEASVYPVDRTNGTTKHNHLRHDALALQTQLEQHHAEPMAFNLNNVAHYGKHLHTWSGQFGRPYKDENQLAISKSSITKQTFTKAHVTDQVTHNMQLKNFFSESSQSYASAYHFRAINEVEENSSLAEEESDYNRHLSGWPWLKVL